MSGNHVSLTESRVTVRALYDAWPLGVTVWQPGKQTGQLAQDAAKSVILLAPATGVPCKLFKHFAAYGHTVLAFDYRMTGSSFPASYAVGPTGLNTSIPDTNADASSFKSVAALETCLKAHRHQATYEHIGRRDYPAVLLHAWKEHCIVEPTRRRDLCIVGHSLGGSILPLALDELRVGPHALQDFQISRVLAVGSSSGWWGYSPTPDLSREAGRFIVQESHEEGFANLKKWGLGNPITLAQVNDWLGMIVESPSWYGAYAGDSGWQRAVQHYDLPVLSVLFSDDELIGNGSARRVDAILRPLGHNASLVESAQEKAYWEAGGEEDPVGATAYKSGSPPAPESVGRSPNASTLTRIHLDVNHNGWVRGSSQVDAKEQGQLPSHIGHIDWIRKEVGTSSASREIWQVCRAWLDERAMVPSRSSRIYGGCGGRLDFGPKSDRAIYTPHPIYATPSAKAKI
ncbi:hypothetical protein CBOM_06996 [Ceraceosorus bombacis]|uniref:Uncharacterized protein n=1 Tax=Ceraceosorus bombacis TaxID=401625 RepID=A0A0P1BKC5_9BASI|nr:hypothetical protein CBOM_06996 [Ceraceosorus bombacis]